MGDVHEVPRLLDRYLVIEIEGGANKNTTTAADVRQINILEEIKQLLWKFSRKIWITTTTAAAATTVLLSSDSVSINGGEEGEGTITTVKKKNPKPPRPPKDKYYSFGLADRKLIDQALWEIAVLKRARIERMKALIRMKNGNSAAASSSSSSSSCSDNPWTLVATLILCLIVLWQAST